MRRGCFLEKEMSAAGEKISRYEIVRELGGGGMGRVFVAHDPRFPRDVALKLLRTNLQGQDMLRRRFRREARTIAALEHHAIVPVYDYGEHDGQLFLVMRLMRGGTLRHRLAHGPLPLDETLVILQRIAAALDKAHSQGIVHRDLKPANILFDDEGNAYLSDFGIVKQTGEQTATALTGAHGVLGTPHYMSPEQALGEAEIDARADVYALGAVAYEMLGGNPPFEADTWMQLLVKHVREPTPSLHALRPDLPPAVDAVLAQAMAKDRQHRFSKAGAFVRALSTVLAAATTGPPDVPQPEPIKQQATPAPRRPYLPYAAGVLVLIVIATAAGLLLRPPPSGPPAQAADGTATATATTQPGSDAATATKTSTVPALSPTLTATATTIPKNTASPTATTAPTVTATATAIASFPIVEPMGQIVFTCYINNWDNLCRIDAGGGNEQRLTTTSATDFYASYTPDGASILFSSLRSGRFLLYSMGALGQNPRRIGPETAGMYAPHMSPDGQQIVFTNVVGGLQSIWVMNADGSNARALTTGEDRDPVWSPDGSRIAFWSDRSGEGAHYIMNANGSGLRRLPAAVDDIGGRSDWSPDGRWLAFYAGGSGDHDIYLVATDGSGEVRRLTDGGNNLAPSFSPDGAWIAFTRYGTREEPDIYIMRPDGSDMRPLTDNTRPDWQPRWGP